MASGERLLPLHAVLSQVGISRSLVYRMMRRGDFPRPRLIAGRSLWLNTEVDAWISQQVAEAPVVGTLVGRRAAQDEKAA